MTFCLKCIFAGGFGSPNDIEMKEATQASGDVVQSQNNNGKMVPVSSVFGPEQEDVKSEEAIDVADEEKYRRERGAREQISTAQGRRNAGAYK